MIDLIIGTFILDFQTVDFESDSKVVQEFLLELQMTCELENSFALDDPVSSAGWSFAKLFLSGQLAEKIYSLRGYEIDGSKGKKFEDRFIAWLGTQLKDKGCGAQVKMAREMKSL